MRKSELAKFLPALKARNIRIHDSAKFITKGRKPTTLMMKDRQEQLQKQLKKFSKSATFRTYLAMIALSYNKFSPIRYYPYDYATDSKSFNENVKRLHDLSARKTSTTRTEHDKAQKTSKKSKYTQWMHSKNIPTEYPALAKYVKANHKTKLSQAEILTIIKKIHKRGLGAYLNGGSRVGATAQQWAKARVYARMFDIMNHHRPKSDNDLLQNFN